MLVSVFHEPSKSCLLASRMGANLVASRPRRPSPLRNEPTPPNLPRPLPSFYRQDPTTPGSPRGAGRTAARGGLPRGCARCRLPATRQRCTAARSRVGGADGCGRVRATGPDEPRRSLAEVPTCRSAADPLPTPLSGLQCQPAGASAGAPLALSCLPRVRTRGCAGDFGPPECRVASAASVVADVTGSAAARARR